MLDKKEVVLSGIRSTTGGLHLGNLKGAVEKFVQLQNSGKYQCVYFIADLHALTTEKDFSAVADNSITVFADMIAEGLDPEKSVIFRQSDVPLVTELTQYFSYMVSVSELERNPIYREQSQELKLNGSGCSAFLNYPVLQAADICLYKGQWIPVGKDQVPHIELSREIARRFNNWVKKDIFPVPEALVTEISKVPGIDGRKMSKSYGNEIGLAHTEEETIRRISAMITDIKRPRRSDPGHPENCSVFALSQCVSEEVEQKEITDSCKASKLGCTECKQNLAKKINEYLRLTRERRTELLSHPDDLMDIIRQGANKAKVIAEATMNEVRNAVWPISNRIR